MNAKQLIITTLFGLIMTLLACEKGDVPPSQIDLETWIGTWIGAKDELIINWKEAQGIPVATRYKNSNGKYTITKSEFENDKLHFEAYLYYLPDQHPDWVNYLRITCVLKSENTIVADFESRTEAQDVRTNYYSVTFEKR